MSWLRRKLSLSLGSTATIASSCQKHHWSFECTTQRTLDMPLLYKMPEWPQGLHHYGCQRLVGWPLPPPTQALTEWFRISTVIQWRVTLLLLLFSLSGKDASPNTYFSISPSPCFPSSLVSQQWAETSKGFAGSIRKIILHWHHAISQM